MMNQTFFKLCLPLSVLMTLLLVSCNKVTVAQLAVKSAVVTTTSLSVTGFCDTNKQKFFDFFTVLRSLRIRQGQVLPNWARDGIADVDKASLGLDVYSDDQGGSGYGNLVLFSAGIPAAKFASQPSCGYANVSTVPGFILNDCDRNFLQLQLNVESVQRNIPDDIALWFQIDLQDPAAGQKNPTGDGYSNLTKIKMNTQIDDTLTDATKALAPIYATTQDSSTGCYTFDVTNIPLVDVSNGNEVDVYILSTDASGTLTEKVKNVVFTPLNSATPTELTYDTF